MRRYNIPTLADGIVARGSIAAEDVAVLRANYFNGEEVWPHEARALFDLLQKRLPACADWNSFIVEALSAYIVEELEPRGSIDEKNARFLIAMLRRDQNNSGTLELGVVQTVMDRAGQATVSLQHYALELAQGAPVPGYDLAAPVEARGNVQEFAKQGVAQPAQKRASEAA